jgi:hypothetical protein
MMVPAPAPPTAKTSTRVVERDVPHDVAAIPDDIVPAGNENQASQLGTFWLRRLQTVPSFATANACSTVLGSQRTAGGKLARSAGTCGAPMFDHWTHPPVVPCQFW